MGKLFKVNCPGLHTGRDRWVCLEFAYGIHPFENPLRLDQCKEAELHDVELEGRGDKE